MLSLLVYTAAIFIFQHNQQYDTLLSITSLFTHKLKAGIAFGIAVAIQTNKKETNVIRRYTRLNIDDTPWQLNGIDTHTTGILSLVTIKPLANPPNTAIAALA